MASDITFDIDVNKNSVTTTRADMIQRTIYTLFRMKPGDDPYEINRGIDIGSKTYSFIGDMEDHRTTIMEQINNYTDYNVSKIEFLSNDKYSIAIAIWLSTSEGDYKSLIVPPSDESSLEVFVTNSQE